MAKFGSKAIPRSPRSPEESTVRLTNGVPSNEPFLITRSWPFCWQTKSRPSGANAIAVGGPDRLLPTCASVNPDGRLAAVATKDTKGAITSSRIVLKLGSRIWKDRSTWFGRYPATLIHHTSGIKARPSNQPLLRFDLRTAVAD